MAFGSTVMVPLDGGADRPGALSARTSASWLPPRALSALLQAVGATAPRRSDARPLALIDLGTTPCSFAGSTSMSYDDADNDGSLDVGEAFSFVFDECQDNGVSVVSGRMSGAITWLHESGTAFEADLTLAPMTQQAVDGSHRLTLDGNVRMSYREPSDTLEQIRIGADGPVRALVLTHLPFQDTVTLRSDFVQDTTYDYSVRRSTSAVSGVMHSARAGGSFAVSTVTPIELHDAERYPRIGLVDMRGRTGGMNLRVLSTEQVQVELDANDDGRFESSKSESWDWLF
jgi:hypothetical protein